MKKRVQISPIIISVLYIIVQVILFQYYLYGFNIEKLGLGFIDFFLLLLLQMYTVYIIYFVSALVPIKAKWILDIIGLAFYLCYAVFFFLGTLMLSAEGCNDYNTSYIIIGLYVSFFVPYIIKMIIDIVLWKKSKAQKTSGSQNVDLQSMNMQNVTTQYVNAPNINSQYANPQTSNPQSMGMQNMNQQNVNAQSMGMQNMNQQNVNAQNMGMQNMNQQNVNAQNMNQQFGNNQDMN